VSGIANKIKRWFRRHGEPLGYEERFPLRTQVTVMTIATVVSVSYIAISAGWWFSALRSPSASVPDGGYYIPTYILMGIMFAVWCPKMLWSDFASGIIQTFGMKHLDPVPKPNGGVSLSRWWTHFARYAAGGMMTIQLGALTLPDGGTFRSPYSQLLVMCIVLAPTISNTWQTGAVMCGLGTLVYGIVGFCALPDEVTRNDILSCVTTVATAAISVVVFYAPLAINWIRREVASRP
jgi:hypothetical protein